MAQPANEKKPLGINAFWELRSQEPPVKWENWRQPITLAIISKVNVDLEDIP